MKRSKEDFCNVHIDFHNPDFVLNIGEKFDPESFIQRLKRSKVDSVTFPAKCHHGNCYYDTKRGNKHPHLNLDIFGEIAKEAHKQGLKFIAYYSVLWDENTSRRNPDWLQVTKEGEKLLGKGTEPSLRWSFLCLNTPYIEEILYPQIDELIQNYDINGFYFDILQYWENTCFCDYCLKRMQGRYDPFDPEERRAFRIKSVEEFIKNTTLFVKNRNPDIWVTYNHLQAIGRANKYKDYVDYYSIEALPAEGGYMRLPTLARYIRNLGLPVEGMTSIFHKSWGDFGTVKHPNQLKYELATSIANGCTVSVGDQLPPEGNLVDYKYDIIKESFDFLEERKAWVVGSRSLKDIGVLGKDDIDIISSPVHLKDKSLLGAVKFLLETHNQFDVLDEEMIKSGMISLRDFHLIILPDSCPLSLETIEWLQQYVATGGRILATYTASLNKDSFGLKEIFGVEFSSFSPYSSGYFRFQRDFEEVPPIDIISYYNFAQVVPLNNELEILAYLVNPTVERSDERFFGHRQAPPSHRTDFPAIVHSRYEKGEIIYIATPLFKDYYESDFYIHRKILEACLNQLYPDRLLNIKAPLSVEISAMEQPEKNRIILHFVNYHVIKRGSDLERIEEFPTWREIPVKIKFNKSIKKVYTAPEYRELQWNREGDYLVIILPSLKIHTMLIIEYYKMPDAAPSK